jgi:uncharacterized protein
MKYVIWVAIIFVGLWWIRQQRSGSNSPLNKKNKGSNVMLPCAHCGLHIPETEAVFGQHVANGNPAPYCSPQHLQQHEGRA